MIRLIRCSQVRNSEDIPNFINSVQTILKKSEFLGGKIKFHYNGKLDNNFFLLCEELNKIHIPISIKTNYNQYIQNIEKLEIIAPFSIVLRDNINFYKEMLEENKKPHSFKLIFQFKANGDEEDKEKIYQIQQTEGLYDWKINPKDLTDKNELQNFSQYLKQNKNNLPSNIKPKGRKKEQEVSFWLAPNGEYYDDTTIYIDGKEIGGNDFLRNKENSEHYEGTKIILENLFDIL